MPTLAVLERRRIEAAILKHVYDTLKASHGAKLAERTVAEAVRRSAIEQAGQMAAAVGGHTSMQTFIDRQKLWTRGGALETEVVEKSDTRYRFKVTRCRYAEMRPPWALARSAICCRTSATRLSVISLKRTQTIMQGASHCDFDYRFDKDGKP
jgi:hypothetical protein